MQRMQCNVSEQSHTALCATAPVLGDVLIAARGRDEGAQTVHNEQLCPRLPARSSWFVGRQSTGGGGCRCVPPASAAALIKPSHWVDVKGRNTPRPAVCTAHSRGHGHQAVLELAQGGLGPAVVAAIDEDAPLLHLAPGGTATDGAGDVLQGRKGNGAGRVMATLGKPRSPLKCW